MQSCGSVEVSHGKIRVRPYEVHACISYIAYNVYKELERVVPGLVSN